MGVHESAEIIIGKLTHPHRGKIVHGLLLPESFNPKREVKLLEVRSAKETLCLSSTDKEHLKKVAEMIKEGGIVAFPFNGVFGLFGDIDCIRAEELILEAKNRPVDRKLIQVCLPEYAKEVADFSKINFKEEQVVKLWKSVHALGIILPAATTAPYHLVIKENSYASVLPIWTEYPPLRYVLECFRKLGGRALVGTSANKMGQPTHWKFDELKEDFCFQVHALVEDDFSHLPEIRRRSTSIIDLTGEKPRLHREGNVTEMEIRAALEKNGFPELYLDRDVITVRPRG